MSGIHTIIIIYNPNSTGNGRKNAEALQQQLAQLPDVTVKLQPTRFAGHAEDLARAAASDEGVMIISSSGDGGYHEVINGILSHGTPTRLIAGLLPSGNANDHYNAIHEGDIVERIQSNDVRFIDLIKVTSGDWVRYAHSYVGIGLTPHIGEKLTQATLNPFKEVWLSLRYYLTLQPVRIRVNDKIERYDSLVFSNIERMSKYLTLSKNAKIDDGKFEITGSKSGPFGKLTTHLFKASTVGLTDDAAHASTFTFQATRPLSLQLDGEVFRFAGRSVITIEVAPKALRCII